MAYIRNKMKRLQSLLFIAIFALTSCEREIEACCTTTNNQLVVEFNSACSIGENGYYWQFGDGTTSTDENPTHAYQVGGTYQVTLRVTGKEGEVSTATELITAVVPNANFSGTYANMETCDSTGADYYSVTLTPSVINDREFTIQGLSRDNALLTAVASINGLTFTIAQQSIWGGTIRSSGSCTANATGTQINLMYTFMSSFSGVSEQCTATLTR